MRTKILTLLFSAFCLTAHAQTTEQEWQHEAVRRYTELGVRGSPLNTAFVAEYQRRKQLPSETRLFANPRWPVLLADECANRLAATNSSQLNPPQAATQTAETSAPANEPTSTTKSSDTEGALLELVNIIVGALLELVCIPFVYVSGGAVIAVCVLLHLWATRCPSCHRWWCRKELYSWINGTTQHLKTVTRYDRTYQPGDQYSPERHVITERKEVVPFERVSSTTRYQCKHCNHEWHEFSHEDKG